MIKSLLNSEMVPIFESKCCPDGLAFSNEGQTWLKNTLAALPRPWVFTNGVFDILHRGHVTYLAQARAFGGSLIVGLNTDASVKMLGKGDDRPINNQEDRMAVLAALQSVDAVILFDTRTPVPLIERIRPDIYIKGGDYDIDTLEETARVRSWGGQAFAIPFLHDRSTTKLLGRVRGASSGNKSV